MPTNTRRMEKVLVTTILVIIDSGETHQWMSNHWLGDSWGEEYSHSLKLSSKREKLHWYPDKGEICECHLDQLKKPTAADNGRNWHQVHVSVKCWKGWTSTEYSCQKDERNYENITGQIQTGGHSLKQMACHLPKYQSQSPGKTRGCSRTKEMSRQATKCSTWSWKASTRYYSTATRYYWNSSGSLNRVWGLDAVMHPISAGMLIWMVT